METNAEKLFIEFSNSKIPSMSNARFLILDIFLHNLSRYNCNNTKYNKSEKMKKDVEKKKDERKVRVREIKGDEKKKNREQCRLGGK